MALMADFARLPTQRKVLAFVIAGALIGALYFQFIFKPLRADVDEAESDHAQKAALNVKLDHDKDDFKALRLRECQLKRILDENQTALPTEAEMPAFFETLNRKVLESGVEVHKWQEEKEEPVESFIKVPVTLEISGSYMQIKKFFASLVEKKKKKTMIAPPPSAISDSGCPTGPIEEHDRVVSIENLKLTNPTVINHEIVLTAHFTAATYREEEEPQDPNAPQVPKRPAPAPASAPAPAGAGTGSGSALPPADTPASAKARVEKAMDKDEQRTRSSPENGATGGSGAKLKGGM